MVTIYKTWVAPTVLEGVPDDFKLGPGDPRGVVGEVGALPLPGAEDFCGVDGALGEPVVPVGFSVGQVFNLPVAMWFY